MSEKCKGLAEAFRGVFTQTTTLRLTIARNEHGVANAITEAEGIAHGCAAFITKELGARKAAEFFYRLGDAVVASEMPKGD